MHGRYLHQASQVEPQHQHHHASDGARHIREAARSQRGEMNPPNNAVGGDAVPLSTSMTAATSITIRQRDNLAREM
jgi:hypothetical protein